MSQSAIAEIVRIMESVPAPMQAQVVEQLRAYVNLRRSLGSLGPTPAAPLDPGQHADSAFTRAVLALPSLPHRNAGPVTSAYVRELLESEG